MSNLLTIPQTIDVGDATVYLMANDYAKGALYGQRLTKETSPVLVAYTTDALRWQYEGLPADSTLRGTANYLLWLSGRFRLEATSLNGGGTVVPVPAGGTTPNPLSFVVSGSSPIITGGNTITLNSGVYDYRGYNLIFSRNNIIQSTTNNGGSWFSWNKSTGVFVCFGAASLDELFDLTPTL